MMMDTPGDSSSRFEKSLGLLTTKFVTLLQEADGGILDLKVVSFGHFSKSFDFFSFKKKLAVLQLQRVAFFFRRKFILLKKPVDFGVDGG